MKKGYLFIIVTVVGLVLGLGGALFGMYELVKDFIYQINHYGLKGDTLFMLIPIIIFPTAIIFVIVILYRTIVKPLRSNKHLQTVGVKSIGFITSTEQTGTTLNEQPQVRIGLEILDEQGQMFPGTLVSFVALTDLAKMQIGAPIPVIYDPQNPSDIGADNNPDHEKMQDALDRYQSKNDPNGLTYSERVELRKYGVKALAVITDLKPTGEKYKEKDEVIISVDIPSTSGGQPINASKKIYVSVAMRDHIHIGGLIDVQYLTGQEHKFSIITTLDRSGL